MKLIRFTIVDSRLSKSLALCTLLVCLLALASGIAPGAARRPAADQAPDTSPSANPGIAIPFPEGEKLIFEIKLSRFLINATLGFITFEYLGPAAKPEIQGATIPFKVAEGETLLALRAEAVSKGFLASVVGFNVKDRYEALVNRRDFSARLSFKEIVEGKKQQTRTAVFDPPREAVVYSTIDLNRAPGQPVIKELPRKESMHSLLSAIFFLRLKKLDDGELICFPVSEDEENHEFEIQVIGREAVELGSRKIAAIKVVPRLFGPGRFFDREGEMTMWLTDDERRVPVKVSAKLSAGTVTATLTNYDAQPPLRQIVRPPAPNQQ